jgi:hypothetical protein
MKKGLLFIVFLAVIVRVSGQSGGDNTYDFLSITNSARVASLGGQQISLYDNDLNMVYHNPSLLTPEMDKHLVVNYINYFAGINIGYVAYAWKPEKNYTLGIGLHYLNYGEFVGADASGIKTGSFRASDYALNFFYSRPILDSLFQFGATVKPLYSQLETYTSLGIAFDLGLTYYNADKLFTAALVVKNTGFQITRYNPDQPREPLPFEIQLGITQQLRHAPFRFSITGQQLQKPNLLYETEEDIADSIDPITGEEVETDPLGEFADNFMRHFILGVEFIPTKNFYISLGYNYKRRQELKIEDNASMVGFSYGFGLKLKKVSISYGRATYHLSGASNHFSASINLSEFRHHL